jgi:hypothetical protein
VASSKFFSETDLSLRSQRSASISDDQAQRPAGRGDVGMIAGRVVTSP